MAITNPIPNGAAVFYHYVIPVFNTQVSGYGRVLNHEAIDAGVASLAHNRCPDGWRKDVDFGVILAHVAPGVELDDEEYADDGKWECSGKPCDARVPADGDLCNTCEADREYYAHDQDD